MTSSTGKSFPVRLFTQIDKFRITVPVPEIDENDEIINLLQTPILDEDLLYLASFKLESASNNFDKNTQKQLKHKIINY